MHEVWITFEAGSDVLKILEDCPPKRGSFRTSDLYNTIQIN